MMDKHLKGIIDSIEEDTRTQAELEQTISVLKNEITNLKLVIGDQKVIIERMNQELKNQTEILPENLSILKDMIVSQRRDLNQRDKEIEVMRVLLEKFTGELEAAIIAMESEYQLIDVPGIGPRNSAKLAKAGITSILQLKNCNVEELASKIDGIGPKKLSKWKKFLINRSEHISFHYI